MGNWTSEPVCEAVEFPNEDFRQKRRVYTPTEAIIPYKPADEPAWTRHHRLLPPKPSRFQKLNRWDQRAQAMSTVCKWAIVVAGAATVAAPLVSKLAP